MIKNCSLEVTVGKLRPAESFLCFKMAAEKNENFVGMIVGNQVRTRYLEWVVVDVSFTLSVLT